MFKMESFKRFELLYHTCIRLNVYSLSQVVSDKFLHIGDTAWGTSTVECQLVSSSEFRLEPILSPQTAKTAKVHYPNPGTQVVSLFHGMGGEDLKRERERERERKRKRENINIVKLYHLNGTRYTSTHYAYNGTMQIPAQW